MTISVGFIKSSQQFVLKTLNFLEKTVQSKVIDTTELIDHDIHLLILGSEEVFQDLSSLLQKEKNYYPIIEARDLGLNSQTFDDLGFHDLEKMFEQFHQRWTLKNNLHSIEILFDQALQLKQLWLKDRTTFFEELWYYLKRNLLPDELLFVFHDLENTIETVNDEEQKDKPKLVTSTLKGKKIAHFAKGEQKENELLKLTLEQQPDSFEITEIDSSKRRFSAILKIGHSPILIMGHTKTLSQLQQSLLIGLTKALTSKTT